MVENKRNSFALLMHNKMKERKLTLREVSRRSGIDAGNLSRIERGNTYPPKKKEVLLKLAEALQMDSTETESLIEQSKFINGQLVNELQNVREMNVIPMLLRAIDNEKLREEDVEKLIEMIKDANTFKEN